MKAALRGFPETERLCAGLVAVLDGRSGGELTVLERRPNEFASTFPSEIITCRVADGGTLRLFCKYETRPIRDGYGHRGGVSYEALVHRHLLRPLRATTPAFYGAHADAATGGTWLVLEYVDGGVRPTSQTPGGLVGSGP